MKLALRLALSHLLIVVLFAVLTIVTFLLSTRPPLPLDNRVETLVKLVQQRPAQGEAEKRFKRLRLPLKSALWAQDSDGSWSSVSGSGTPPTLSKEQLASTWQGQDVLSFTPEDGTATYSFPVFEDGKVVQVGLLRNWGDRRLVDIGLVGGGLGVSVDFVVAQSATFEAGHRSGRGHRALRTPKS